MQRNAECEMQRTKRTAFGCRKAQKRDAERKKNSSLGLSRRPALGGSQCASFVVGDQGVNPKGRKTVRLGDQVGEFRSRAEGRPSLLWIEMPTSRPPGSRPGSLGHVQAPWVTSRPPGSRPGPLGHIQAPWVTSRLPGSRPGPLGHLQAPWVTSRPPG